MDTSFTVKIYFLPILTPQNGGVGIKKVACDIYYCPMHCINNLKLPGERKFGKTSIYTSFALSSSLKPQQNTRSYWFSSSWTTLEMHLVKTLPTVCCHGNIPGKNNFLNNLWTDRWHTTSYTLQIKGDSVKDSVDASSIKSCMLKKACLQGLPHAVSKSPQECEQKGDQGIFTGSKKTIQKSSQHSFM